MPWNLRAGPVTKHWLNPLVSESDTWLAKMRESQFQLNLINRHKAFRGNEKTLKCDIVKKIVSSKTFGPNYNQILQFIQVVHEGSLISFCAINV